MEVAKYVLSDGALREDGFYIFDKGFLPSTFKKPFVITDNNSEFICDKEFDDIRDGKWVISIDGEITLLVYPVEESSLKVETEPSSAR